MPKSYYQNGNFILPFSQITTIIDSTSTIYMLEVHVVSGKSYGIFESQAGFFKSQYIAWLESQSNHML